MPADPDLSQAYPPPCRVHNLVSLVRLCAQLQGENDIIDACITCDCSRVLVSYSIVVACNYLGMVSEISILPISWNLGMVYFVQHIVVVVVVVADCQRQQHFFQKLGHPQLRAYPETACEQQSVMTMLFHDLERTTSTTYIHSTS